MEGSEIGHLRVLYVLHELNVLYMYSLAVNYCLISSGIVDSV